MFRSYFFLNRTIAEANREFQGNKVISFFSQEKDKLIVELIKEETNVFLEISVNPGFPYFNFRSNYNRAKKNTIDFYHDYNNQKIISFQIADDDRIIKIKLEKSELYFAIRGKYTNVYLIDNNKVFEFKKSNERTETDFLNEVENKNFIENFIERIFDIEDDVNDLLNNLRKKYPFIGREIIKEVKARISSEDEVIETLHNILNEIKKDNPTVFIDENTKEVNLGFENFQSIPFTHKDVFDNIFPALSFFLKNNFYLTEEAKNEKIILKHLDRELGKISSKMNSLKTRIEKGSREEEYKKIGNLILINLTNMHAGMEFVELKNIYENSDPVKIKLDKKLSPKQNADLYFDKSKSERINFKKSKELFMNAKEEYDNLISIKSKLNVIKELEDYKKIMKDLKIKDIDSTSKKDELKSKFRHYIIENKYHVFVGKDSRNNDLLTTKFAKQNDYWFHARSVPGSHVVLRVDNAKEGIPKNILKKAAAIAGFYSKSKTSSLAPISYTQKKYVVKKKGMEPGKVALMKEDVILVKPEIPKDVEFAEVE